MSWISRIFDFYIQASIHVALAVVSLFWISGFILNISPPIEGALLVFSGSLSCYNFIKYGFGLNNFQNTRSRRRKLIGIFSILSGLLAMFLLQNLNTAALGLLAFLMLLVFFYALPFQKKEINLRSLGILKVSIVALVWTGLTVIFPVAAYQLTWDWDVFILVIQRFLLVVALIIPFEIRDMNFDPPHIKTLPRRLGIKKTKLLGIGLLFLTLLLILLKDWVSVAEWYTRAVMIIIAGWLIWKTPSKPSAHYASFWVEAIPIFWLGLYGIYFIWF